MISKGRAGGFQELAATVLQRRFLLADSEQYLPGKKNVFEGFPNKLECFWQETNIWAATAWMFSHFNPIIIWKISVNTIPRILKTTLVKVFPRNRYFSYLYRILKPWTWRKIQNTSIRPEGNRMGKLNKIL